MITTTTTPQQLLVFETIRQTLPTITLAQGGYAFDSQGRPCGLHSSTAEAFDLAALLWQACELHTYVRGEDCDAQQQQLFRECWYVLRQHFQWDKKLHSSDTRLCKWLDSHTSKKWYLTVLEQIISGVPYETVRTTTAPTPATKAAIEKKLTERMAEYE